jgi:hypothetical protein
LLAKFFASKLAPTGGFWLDDFSGIKPESGSIIRRKRRGIQPEEIKGDAVCALVPAQADSISTCSYLIEAGKHKKETGEILE